MIRNVLLPEAYNGYYLLETYIVGIHVTPDALYATKIVASGWQRRIQHHVYEPLDTAGDTFAQRADGALHNITGKIGTYHRLHIALPSKDAIFKELTLPFTDMAKIEMVAPFELEDTLPFSLDEAVVTTLPIDRQEEQTTVLTATYRHHMLDAYLDAFASHGLFPDMTTIDAVAYYNAFYTMQEFLRPDDIISYIDIDIHTTRIFVIDHGALRVIRTLNHGISSICSISDESHTALKQSVTSCDVSTKTMHNATLASEIQFTLAAANKALGPQSDISRVMITGLGSHVTGMAQLLASYTPVQPYIMNANIPLRMPYMTTETNSHVPPVFMTSVAVALPVPEDRMFHIRRSAVTRRERDLRTRQLAVATGMTLVFFITLFGYSMYTARQLQAEVQQREQHLRTNLTDTFELQQRDTNAKLSYLINNAIPKKVSQDESLWFSLSQGQTYSFLYYLQEMSNTIDRQELGLTLRKLTIQRDNKQGTETVKMEGSVPDFPQLQSFEQALRDTGLFTHVPSLQETKFDITLTIAESPGEAS